MQGCKRKTLRILQLVCFVCCSFKFQLKGQTKTWIIQVPQYCEQILLLFTSKQYILYLMQMNCSLSNRCKWGSKVCKIPLHSFTSDLHYSAFLGCVVSLVFPRTTLRSETSINNTNNHRFKKTQAYTIPIKYLVSFTMLRVKGRSTQILGSAIGQAIMLVPTVISPCTY